MENYVSNNELNTIYLARENIKRKPFRSISLMLMIALLTMAMLVGTILVFSLRQGLDSLANRLGADVMVVPEGHETEIDSILLTGKPTKFYLPSSAVDKLSKLEAVDKLTPQIYIATLNASCCSYPVQLIGIDYESDFLIKPWLEESINTDLEYGEVIVGKRIAGEVNDKVKFFEHELKVVGRLEQTGMGFDSAVFINKETALSLAKAAERITGTTYLDKGDLISCVMIKLKPGYDSVTVAREITAEYADEGLYGMFSKKFVNNISSNLASITNYVQVIVLVIFVLAIVIISLFFVLILNERKKEMAVYRVLGATRKKLFNLVISESFLISIYGAFIGLLIAGIVIFLSAGEVSKTLNLPFLLPGWLGLSLITLVSFLVGVLVGPLASLSSALKLAKVDVYQNMRDRE